MGGGTDFPDSDDEHSYEDALRILHMISEAGVASGTEVTCGHIIEDYNVIDIELSSKMEQNDLVGNCAAYLEILSGMRDSARRCKGLDVQTYALVTSCKEEVKILAQTVTSLQHPLERNTMRVRPAAYKVVEKLEAVSAMAKAVAQAHKAVGCDVKAMLLRAAKVMNEPARADAGFLAAPWLGGGAVALLARGLGPVGALALFGLGALGAAGFTSSTMYPSVVQRFTNLYNELSEVAGLLQSKEAALMALGFDLNSAASQLATVLEVPPNGSDRSSALLEEGLAACRKAFELAGLRCEGCQYRGSAFGAIHRQPTSQRIPFRNCSR